jgi:prolipoprotein diacylglyceryl transferase
MGVPKTMTILNYIIWNPNPVIFQLGDFSVRWYGLCVLLAFLGGSAVIRHIYQKEGRRPEEGDNFALWVLITALVGARLGEIFFYNFGYYLSHPIEAFLPVTFDPHFKFTGYQGLSYHGALVGSLLGTYLYAHYLLVRSCKRRTAFQLSPFKLTFKKKPSTGRGFLWLTTPLALGMMFGFFVRIGNFVNSEITGTPTHSQSGVLFARGVTERLQRSSEAVEAVRMYKDNTHLETAPGAYTPVKLEITFKNVGFEEAAVRDFLENKIKYYLATNSHIGMHVYEPEDQPLRYQLSSTRNNGYVATIATLGIPRHPAQLYEAIAYILTIVLLLGWWNSSHKTLRDGTIAGVGMIVCYGLRFIVEFFKDPFSILFEGEGVVLTMGHLLSLLTVLGGVLLLVYIYVLPSKKPSTNALDAA